LKACPADYVLADGPEAARRLRQQAATNRLNITVEMQPPPGVHVVQGNWPGTKSVASGENERMSAGPTGEPWIDSNGWKVLLALAQQPAREVWVDAAPKEPRLYPENYVAALADSAAHGGRWIIELDQRLAAGVAAGNAASLAAWKRLSQGARFFSEWRWPGQLPLAWIGVVSDFAGDNEFLGQEVLNLLARGNQPYRIIPLERASNDPFAELKAVLYVDQKPPSTILRAALSGFAERGGLLVVGQSWGTVAGRAERGDDHPRYEVRRTGKGRIAVATESQDDPYVVVQDAVVLLSHRHDLVRFWNGGAVRACLSASPDRRRALLQMVFYANARAGDSTVRVAGRYRTATLYTPVEPVGREVPLIAEKDAVELHLPAIGPYGAVELDS
jgi:hypothetical protein